ncbi:MAG TPA: SRPBCC family protein, partial [Gaiellaceae bacterium]|nr:SRPBCC family protein [Gaiellaceae bacterium]
EHLRGTREPGGAGMARIEGEIVIERPPAEVFDVVADECNEPRYDPRPLSVERLSPRPIGVGTRFRAETATRRGAAGMTIELTAYERQLRLASATRLSGMDIRGTLTFDPVPPGGSCAGGGTWEPHGLLGPAGPLVATAGRRRERRIWTGLERFLEARAASPPDM